jgi:hypothetical protein
MNSRTIDDGVTVYVATDEERVGSEGPFRVVYRGENAENRWGYLCSACDCLDTAMDTMGRIVCNGCGNVRKPEEWDATHE